MNKTKLSKTEKIQLINNLKKAKKSTIRKLCKILNISKSTYYYNKNNYYKKKEKVEESLSNNYIYNCNHNYSWLCEYLIEFNQTKKGKIYGYPRIFPAFKVWLNSEKEIVLNFELSPKQMRKIMKDHNIQGISRSTNKNNRKIKTKSDWKEEMNKVKSYKNVNKSNQIWSMDTKTIKTEEGYLYLFVIIDFYSHNVISWSINESKSFEKLILPALEKISFSQNNNTILHSDNAAEFYCEAMQKWANTHNINLSRKKPMHLGGNALSENWFYHLSVEWLPKGKSRYKTFIEAINDVNEYILFYNYERIHSKFLLPPIMQIRI